MMTGQRAVSFDPGDSLGLFSGVRGLYTGDMAYNMGTLFGSAALSSNNQRIMNFGAGATTRFCLSLNLTIRCPIVFGALLCHLTCHLLSMNPSI